MNDEKCVICQAQLPVQGQVYNVLVQGKVPVRDGDEKQPALVDAYSPQVLAAAAQGLSRLTGSKRPEWAEAVQDSVLYARDPEDAQTTGPVLVAQCNHRFHTECFRFAGQFGQQEAAKGKVLPLTNLPFIGKNPFHLQPVECPLRCGVVTKVTLPGLAKIALQNIYQSDLKVKGRTLGPYRLKRQGLVWYYPEAMHQGGRFGGSVGKVLRYAPVDPDSKTLRKLIIEKVFPPPARGEPKTVAVPMNAVFDMQFFLHDLLPTRQAVNAHSTPPLRDDYDPAGVTMYATGHQGYPDHKWATPQAQHKFQDLYRQHLAKTVSPLLTLAQEQKAIGDLPDMSASQAWAKVASSLGLYRRRRHPLDTKPAVAVIRTLPLGEFYQAFKQRAATDEILGGLRINKAQVGYAIMYAVAGYLYDDPHTRLILDHFVQYMKHLGRPVPFQIDKLKDDYAEAQRDTESTVPTIAAIVSRAQKRGPSASTAVVKRQRRASGSPIPSVETLRNSIAGLSPQEAHTARQTGMAFGQRFNRPSDELAVITARFLVDKRQDIADVTGFDFQTRHLSEATTTQKKLLILLLEQVLFTDPVFVTRRKYDKSLPGQAGPMEQKQLPRVVNVKVASLRAMPERYQNLEAWLAASPDHMYIGRNMEFYVKGAKKSIWANPFKVKKADGEAGLARSLAKYRAYVLSKPQLVAQLPTLRGKVLGCWCKPKACHGDVLVELVKSVESRGQ